MNKLLILLLLLVIIKLFNYKEGLCSDKCSNCEYININSIISGSGDCGKECISCTNITISDYLKNFLEKIFGKEKIYTESTEKATSYNYEDLKEKEANETKTETKETDIKEIDTKTANTNIFSIERIKKLWTDVSNGDVQPSVYNCTKDVSDNWVPYENGESLCVLDVNGKWRYYEDISGSEDCEPIKCIADFGTEIGQLTCCGQNSLLKSTKYVCPMNLPTCNNFKCGSEFGTCSK